MKSSKYSVFELSSIKLHSLDFYRLTLSCSIFQIITTICIPLCLLLFTLTSCRNEAVSSNSNNETRSSNIHNIEAKSSNNQSDSQKKNFAYDRNWREHIMSSDTEQCIVDIILRNDVRYFITTNSDSEKAEITAKLLSITSNIITEIHKQSRTNNFSIADTITALDKLTGELEEKIYKQSLGRYKCDYNHIKRNGPPESPFMSVYTFQIINYANDAGMKFYYATLQAFGEEAGVIMFAELVFNTMILYQYLNFSNNYNENTQIHKDNEIDVDTLSSQTNSNNASNLARVQQPPAQAVPLPISPQKNTDAQAKSIASLITHQVERVIMLEEGKSVGQFFSIKQGLKPCLKNPNICTDSIAPLVRESYIKFNRGIIATLLLNNDDSFDINMFKKIQTTLLLPMTDSSEKVRIANKSPVGREIMKTIELSTEDRNNIFAIWYLRQIPYAGENIWKDSNTRYSWDYYLKRADHYLEQVSNDF